MKKIKCIIFIFLIILIALSNVVFGEYEWPVHWGDEGDYSWRQNGAGLSEDFHYAYISHLDDITHFYQGDEFDIAYIMENGNNTFDKKIKSIKVSLSQRKDVFEKWEREDIYELHDGVSIKSYEEDSDDKFYYYFIEFNIENPIDVTGSYFLMCVNIKIRDDAPITEKYTYYSGYSSGYFTFEDDEKINLHSENVYYFNIMASQTKPNDTNTVNNTVNNVVNNVVNNTVSNTTRNIVNNTVVNRVQNRAENRVQNDVVPDSPNNPPQNPSGGETGGAGNDQTISNDNLPFTGYKAIIIPIIVIAIIGYTFYRKYEKYNY